MVTWLEEERHELVAYHFKNNTVDSAAAALQTSCKCLKRLCKRERDITTVSFEYPCVRYSRRVFATPHCRHNDMAVRINMAEAEKKNVDSGSTCWLFKNLYQYDEPRRAVSIAISFSRRRDVIPARRTMLAVHVRGICGVSAYTKPHKRADNWSEQPRR